MHESVSSPAFNRGRRTKRLTSSSTASLFKQLLGSASAPHATPHHGPTHGLTARVLSIIAPLTLRTCFSPWTAPEWWGNGASHSNLLCLHSQESVVDRVPDHHPRKVRLLLLTDPGRSSIVPCSNKRHSVPEDSPKGLQLDAMVPPEIQGHHSIRCREVQPLPSALEPRDHDPRLAVCILEFQLRGVASLGSHISRVLDNVSGPTAC